MAVGLVAAAPAYAQVPGDAVRAVPNKAGVGTHLFGDLRASEDPQSGGQSPRQIFIDLPAGLKSDSRARSETCSKQQAASFECPASSKIGTGFVNATLIHSSGAFPPQSLVADVEGFLGPPERPGDEAAVVFQIKERSSGQRATATGRVVRLAPPYGLGLWVEDLESINANVPAGFRLRMDRIYADNGASRTVKKKAYKYVRRNGKRKRVRYYKKIRYDLFKNPRTCPSGGWPWSVRLVYPDGAQSVREASMQCSG